MQSKFGFDWHEKQLDKWIEKIFTHCPNVVWHANQQKVHKCHKAHGFYVAYLKIIWKCMKSGNLKSNLKVLWCQGKDLARWRLMPQSWRIFILQVVAANTRASRWTLNNGGKETNEKDHHRWRSTAMHSKAISGWIGLDWILLVLLEHLAVLTNKVLVKELERKEEGDWLESIQSSKHFHTRAPYLREKRSAILCQITQHKNSKDAMVNERSMCAVLCCATCV